MPKFLLGLVLACSISACKTTNTASTSESVYQPTGGIFGGKGQIAYTSADGTAVCMANVNLKRVTAVTGTADPTDFKRILSQLAGVDAEDFYQTYLAKATQQYTVDQMPSQSARTLATLSFNAIQAAQAAVNPAACNSMSTPGGSGSGGTATPAYLFVPLSYGQMLDPVHAHTFGFAAKMAAGQKDKIVEHVPISWLPAITGADGRPTLDDNGELQIADVLPPFRQTKLGWSYTVNKTVATRAKSTGRHDAVSFGAYPITAAQYEAIKQFRDQLNQNTIGVAAGQAPASKYFYQAADPELFKGCDESVPGAVYNLPVLNCFQAMMASFGICSKTFAFSGGSATGWITGILRGRGALPDKPYYSDRESVKVQGLVDQVLAIESASTLDQPSVN